MAVAMASKMIPPEQAHAFLVSCGWEGAEILPLASPRILRKAARWLFDPLGPLSLPPAYLPRIAPWLLTPPPDVTPH